ncbi:uncharacterized protein PG986_003733 [Apiospora aurea]|uniref:Uncharacterized protein n=1 Tax=Apiospora aurea TaxID=335848 RepID=A0ABR1QSX0_9PEZI
MPFFSSRKPEDEVVEEPAPVHEEQHKRSLFGSRRERSVSPVSTTHTNTTTTSHSSNGTGTYFPHPSTLSHRRNFEYPFTNPSSPISIGRKSSILHRSFGHGNKNVELDPSIVQARERVMGAEKAEIEADRALNAARIQVREAREEVKRLELEAKEEARRAKVKQYHAAEVSKRGKQLGRHGI